MNDTIEQSTTRTRTPRQRLILVLGSCAGLGYCPVASGTVTVAVLGSALFYLLRDVPWWGQIIILAVLIPVSAGLSGAGDRILGENDSRKLVVDEIAGYLVAVFAMPWSWPMVAASLACERALDISKLQPAKWVEDHVPGGWGVVLDDVVAGLYTQLVLRLVLYWQPQWLLW